MGRMSSIYGTSIIPFPLKNFPFQHYLLLSPRHKSFYGDSNDRAHEGVSGYALGLKVFVLFESCNVGFHSY